MDIPEILDQVRSNAGPDNLAKSLVREKCSISMVDIPSQHVLVDVDLAFESLGRTQDKRCDLILFFGSIQDYLIAVPMELQRGTIHASDVANQLEGGVRFAAQLAPTGIQCLCVPLVVHGRSIDRHQRKILSDRKIMFRKRRMSIRTTSCNKEKNLANALSEWI